MLLLIYWCCCCIYIYILRLYASEWVSEWASVCVWVSEWVFVRERVCLCEWVSEWVRASVWERASVCASVWCVCDSFPLSTGEQGNEQAHEFACVSMSAYLLLTLFHAVLSLSMTSLTLRVSSVAYSCRSWLESSLKDVRLSCPRLSSCRNAWQQR